MAAVSVNSITKSFVAQKRQPIAAVLEVSLDITDGELLALVGPSGCGKTTLLRLIAGLEEPDRGLVAIDGKAQTGIPPGDRHVAMLFQSPALYPHLTIRENLALPLRLRRATNAESEATIRETAVLLGISGLLDRLPEQLSGGERQRVALGRALVTAPKVLLLDEPLSNLDAPMRLQLRREIARIQRRLRITTIYVTHDQQEALALGDRIAVMSAGVIQQVGTPAEIYGKPRNRVVAEFIGMPPMNLLRCHVERRDAAVWLKLDHGSSAVGTAPEDLAQSIAAENEKTRLAVDAQVGAALSRLLSESGTEIVLGLRPEHLTAFSAAANLPDGAIRACVELVENLGPEKLLHVRCGSFALVVRVPPTAEFGSGSPVHLVPAWQHAHWFDPRTGERLG